MSDEIKTTASKPCDMPGCSSYAIGGGRWCPKHHAESETTRIPAEVFHPSEFILEEMEARGWDRDEMARRMGSDVAINRLSLDLYCEVGPTEPNLRIGDGEDLARAFGTSAEFWTNLETAWLKGVQNV